MKNFIKEVDDKLSHIIWALVFYGFVFMIIAVLIAFTSYLLQILVGLALLLLAYVLFYLAYKVSSIKKIISK